MARFESHAVLRVIFFLSLHLLLPLCFPRCLFCDGNLRHINITSGGFRAGNNESWWAGEPLSTLVCELINTHRATVGRVTRCPLLGRSAPPDARSLDGEAKLRPRDRVFNGLCMLYEWAAWPLSRSEPLYPLIG